MTYLTNIIVDSLDEKTNEGFIRQLFIDLFTTAGGLYNFCQSFPNVRMFISPPNVRLTPSWYPAIRPTIIRVLHQFLQTKPPNLQLLQDYSGDLEHDGIHYTILAGINFVKGLTDQVLELIKVRPTEQVVS